MGLATAKMLLDGGARVLVTVRSKEGLESAQKELGNEAIVVSSDARSLTDLDALAARVKADPSQTPAQKQLFLGDQNLRFEILRIIGLQRARA